MYDGNVRFLRTSNGTVREAGVDDKAELGALVRNNDSPKDGLYSDRERFALASLVLYIQPFENRSVRLFVSYSTKIEARGPAVPVVRELFRQGLLRHRSSTA